MDGSISTIHPSSSQTETNTEKAKLSRLLYIFAWTVEVIAVLTGLAISIIIGIDAFNKIAETKSQIAFHDYINTAISVFPFFLVAIVEITKIPVAGAAFHASSAKWKFVFTCTLIFLAVITFETALNGFERNFTNLTYVINKEKEELNATKDRIAAVNDERTKAKELTAEWIEERYNTRRSELASDRDTQTRSVQDKIQELQASLQTDLVTALKEELKSLRSERDVLISSRDAEISRVQLSFDKQRDSVSGEISQQRSHLSSQISRISQQLETARRSREEAIAEAGFFSRGEVTETHNKFVADLEAQQARLQQQYSSLTTSGQQGALASQYNNKIDEVTKRFDKRLLSKNRQISAKSREIAKIMGTKENDVAVLKKGLLEELSNIEAKFNKQQQANSDDRARLMEKLANNQSHIDELDKELATLQRKAADLRDSINKEAGDNQVYRLTMSWTGADSAADIERDEVALTAAVWFGSLAAVVALTGILLALASFVLKADSKKMETLTRGPSPLNRLINSLRRGAIYKRQLQRKPKIEKVLIEKEIPKEVVKEVPVDRVVIKEVPKEIIEKRIVHVPLYTNDHSLVERSAKWFSEELKSNQNHVDKEKV